MNEVVIPSVLLDVPVPAATVHKQNLLDLDREGLEHFFADTLGNEVAYFFAATEVVSR